MRLLHQASLTHSPVADDEIIVGVTREELVILAGGIRESLEEIEEWEFHTRMGITRDEAKSLRDKIRTILEAD
ncbi:hypothetical protein [Mycobacterium sp. D16Q16]|uniref:hypothetical protein n=1 Tax=Mycobacterium sp. D16Q16 TaxID=1855659 RepID=UPI00111795F3|nr:hypothetical protein [Mycobacterium sp. D16Q16]